MKLGDQETLQRLFGPTAECLPVEELHARLERGSAPSQRHLKACAHCAAELDLYREFLKQDPMGAAPSAVAWVENRIQMPWAKLEKPRWSWSAWSWRPRILAPVAITMAALVLTLGVGVRSQFGSRTRLDLLNSAERSSGIELITPKGDVAAAPDELRWKAVAGAAQYRVRVLEVDRVSLWQATTTSPTMRLPQEIRGKALPGKRLVWEVEALDSIGKMLAQGSQDFKRRLNANR